MTPGGGGVGKDLGLTGSLSFPWLQIKELLKKLEQLSEEVLAVRRENVRLASQLQVCLALRDTAREEGGSGSVVGDIAGIAETCSGNGPGWASDGPRETICLILLFLMLGGSRRVWEVGT